MKLDWRNTLCGIQALAAVAFAAACERIVDPPLPETAVAFVPPPVYARWWEWTTRCSGIPGSLASISWFVVPGVTQFNLKKEVVSAYRTERTNSIVIADSSRVDGNVVRHEMLHALVRTSGHPRSAFLDHCLGVVDCTQACVSDAGPPPEPSLALAVVTHDSIDVQVQFLPAKPMSSIDGRVTSGGIRGSVDLRDPAVTEFAAGETKRQYFDFDRIQPR